jgi:hypothetical protein
MRSKMVWVILLLFLSSPLFGETWYVRRDGGTRYSAKMRTGQCDGRGDEAYPGRGTNKHCAFKDYRYLWDDQSYNSNAWAISGGDTVILRDGPWRVGWDSNTGPGAGYTWCLGRNNYDCHNPPIPAGTAAQHTRILGEHYGSCSQGKMTQLYGGFGVGTVLNLRGAQYVDVKCVELTRHSQCIQHGSPAYPGECNKGSPTLASLDDFASNGILTDVNTHDLLLEDVWVHGLTSSGVIGPIGGVVTATGVDIAYNGSAGWNFDDGNSTANVNGVWNFNHSIIEWNGCNQAYPGVGAISCYDQESNGYGDGVGTSAGTCLTANIDHATFRYNTQDGLDLGHIDKGTCSLTITYSTAYGNMGGQFKWGANANPAVFENNTVVGNCKRMSETIAGQPSSYNAHLSNFCRAEDALSFNFRQGGTVVFANNTIVTYAPTTFDIGCWDQGGCSSSTLTFKNNIVLGYDNHGVYNLGGKPGGPGGFYYQHPIGHVIRSNNLYYGIRGFRCSTENPGERCDDPQLVSQPRFSREQDLDSFNFHLSATSPAHGSGANIP